MADYARSGSWRDELATLVGDDGAAFLDDGAPTEGPAGGGGGGEGEEGWKEQAKGFLSAAVELAAELGRGCLDIARQSLASEESSAVVKRLARPCTAVSRRLRFLNEYLPEDKDPVHAWPVVVFVFLVALSVLTVTTEPQTPITQPKKVHLRPPNATRIQLPDGRNIAYEEQGVPAANARFTVISPHTFLSSRFAGVPGIKVSLLEEFGVRLVTYDLPGFGESDPHPQRNLSSSAMDISHLADVLGVNEKFWVLGYSGGGMHTWAAVRHIPDKLAGAALFAPLCNPYDSRMTKEERHKTWEKWTSRRKFAYFLARRFPSFLPYFYRRSFLSGRHAQPDKWLSFSLGRKDRALMQEPNFISFWEKDFEESVRQGNPKPFVEEAVLQVSNWGFSLADLQMQKKRQGKGFLPWLKSMYSPAELELAGFLGPIHIWQGTDDRVVPLPMIDFVRRVLPGATVHRLPGEGHFSYYFFCDECHRQILSTLFGTPQGPLTVTVEDKLPRPEEGLEDTLLTYNEEISSP